MLSATKTVRELAVEVPSATRVFERLGIDYCCGGGQSLEEACSSAKVKVDDVLRTLEAEAAPAAIAAAVDWTSASLAKLIDHIVATHHAYVKAEVPRLEQLIAKVASVHGQNHPELKQVQSEFRTLGAELGMHMMKEEQILFPYIADMEAAVEAGRSIPPCVFGTVQNPVQMMVMEHDAAGENLHAMREATDGFRAPADACVSYTTLYRALAEFEADLHQHIHLENNILFPRAVEMERQG